MVNNSGEMQFRKGIMVKCTKSEKSRNIKRSEAGIEGWLELKFISNPLESRGAKHTPVGEGGVQHKHSREEKSIAKKKGKEGMALGWESSMGFFAQPHRSMISRKKSSLS